MSLRTEPQLFLGEREGQVLVGAIRRESCSSHLRKQVRGSLVLLCIGVLVLSLIEADNLNDGSTLS